MRTRASTSPRFAPRLVGMGGLLLAASFWWVAAPSFPL